MFNSLNALTISVINLFLFCSVDISNDSAKKFNIFVSRLFNFNENSNFFKDEFKGFIFNIFKY